MNDKDFNLLVLFVAIWEERNLSRVAERLCLSQPAVSHALNRMREQFDDPLFVRSSKGMTPTDFARSISDEVMTLVRSLEGVYQRRQEFRPEDQEGEIVLCIGDYFAANFLQDFTVYLKKHAPKVNIVCRPDSEVFDLESFERGYVSLAITGFLIQEKEGFYTRELVQETISCFFRKNHSLLKNQATLENYLKCEHLFISAIGSTKGLVDQKLEKLKKKRNVSFVVPGFFEAGELLAKSDFVLTGPTGLCQYLSKKHRLHVVPTPFEMPVFPISMYWHERTQNDPFYAWVRNVIVELQKKKIKANQ